jgi:hypothetical protein
MEIKSFTTNSVVLASHCSTPLIQKLSFALAVRFYPFSLKGITAFVFTSVLTNVHFVSTSLIVMAVRAHWAQSVRTWTLRSTFTVTFEVLVAVAVRNILSWDVTPCRLVNFAKISETLFCSAKERKHLLRKVGKFRKKWRFLWRECPSVMQSNFSSACDLVSDLY